MCHCQWLEIASFKSVTSEESQEHWMADLGCTVQVMWNGSIEPAVNQNHSMRDLNGLAGALLKLKQYSNTVKQNTIIPSLFSTNNKLLSHINDWTQQIKHVLYLTKYQKSKKKVQYWLVLHVEPLWNEKLKGIQP